MEKKDPLEVLGLVRFLRFLKMECKAGYSGENTWGDLIPPNFRTSYTLVDGPGSEHESTRTRAEKSLNQLGWRMNVTGKVTRIRKGRGADLLAECAWAIYTEKHQRKGNTPSIRRKIARELAPYFEESELSVDAKAPIYQAIYNRDNPPR